MLGLLRSNGETSVRELVSEIGLSVSQVRYRRNALISAGVIEPTVGATSRLRRQLVRGERGLVAPREGGYRGQVREAGAVGDSGYSPVLGLRRSHTEKLGALCRSSITKQYLPGSSRSPHAVYRDVSPMHDESHLQLAEIGRALDLLTCRTDDLNRKCDQPGSARSSELGARSPRCQHEDVRVGELPQGERVDRR